MATGNYFLRKKFPFIPIRGFTYAEWNETEGTYAKWSKAEHVITLITLWSLPWPYALFLHHIYLEIYKVLILAPSVFFPVGWVDFFLPAIVFSFASTLPVTNFIMKKLLRKRYTLFLIYKNTKDDYDNEKVSNYLFRILLYPFALTLMMTFTSRLIATGDTFSYQNLLDLRQYTYRYTEITKATYYLHFINSNNEKLKQPHYKITFRDNNTFATNWYFNDVVDARKFIDHLMAKGIMPDTADIDY